MDGLLLALGTLTAIPVPAVRSVTPATARGAMLLAPLAALPLAAAVMVVVAAGAALSLPAWSVAFVALAALAAGSRALHLDGLSDVADGLVASFDRERSLAVMKGGTAGPAGAATLVLVLGAQAGALAALADDLRGALLAGAAVCGSRAALWITSARVVPAARPGGLGATFTGTVPVAFAALGWLAIGAASALVDPVRGPVTVAAAALAVMALTRHAVRRFGGVTGDVFGAGIEVALTVLLIGAAAA
ncbi:adenosylcobinamide-GDP ribazoletransferase [Nocardioides sp. GY 10113]|nr:adenosylcobinamide-GDP ribazoletransferase [Nocardioides sp. GY 10113]